MFRDWAFKINRESNILIHDLTVQIKEITDSGDVSEDDLELLHDLKRELQALEREAETKSFARAKTNWALYGGKPSKFFLNMEKRSYENKIISVLIDDDGKEISTPSAILEYERSQFEARYAQKVHNSSLPDPYSDIETSIISEEEALAAEAPLTLDELEKAVKAMSNSKTPGSDSLPAEFYKKFWFLVGQWVLDCFNAANEKGVLGPEQRRGIITLVPKKG